MKQWTMAENTPHAVTIKETPIVMKFMMRLFNPLMRKQVRKGKASSVAGVILLHFTGRKTGKRYEIPVMKQTEDGRMCVYTEARWKANLRGGADVEVTDMGVRTPMRAELMDDPDAMAAEMEELIGRIGLKEARKRLGVVVHVGRPPTREELAEAIRRRNLGIVYLTPL
ncbi:nitroreductase/quinone reductase family protein [Streptosporangium sp. NPDC002721]|uniref:nitroreductase/quinone reductase family protein n=1 Tax=Streptosporangium sp. NPDC002721 TaxID=3366188 RepID=UPI0036B723D8